MAGQGRHSARRERERIEHDLRERVKELGCLYGIARLLDDGLRDVARLMQRAVRLLPPAWQYPEVTSARILYEGRSFTAPRYRRSRHRQEAPLHVHGRQAGSVEVCYLRKMPDSDEGPFLREERALIDAVAERLSRTAEWFEAEDQLRRAHAELQVERKALQESNAALRTVLARIEDEKSSIRQAVAANVEKILLPILHAFEAELPPDRQGYARLLRHHLEEIASPFVDSLSRRALSLTPAEVRICSMIKMGLTTKEVARLRHVAPATVCRQRESIRRKLGLSGRDANLATFLQTMATRIPRQAPP